MLIAFFDIQRIVLEGWLPGSQMANQQNYIEVLTK
jgi:hypothetical protein